MPQQASGEVTKDLFLHDCWTLIKDWFPDNKYKFSNIGSIPVTTVLLMMMQGDEFGR